MMKIKKSITNNSSQLVRKYKNYSFYEKKCVFADLKKKLTTLYICCK